ncbi:Inner membrane protein YihY, formerly thought to be RNase BN [Sandaracinus amylolyticus]|nr:Inner membrane protein YihY, formerly thought to be RNase BN [Sandaracinus amylolyticus]
MPDDRRSWLTVAPLPAPLERGVAYLSRALFEIDETTLSPPRRWLVLALRLAWLTTRGFFRERLQIRAASLAFATILAIVPAAALAFAIADVLGATDLLIHDTLEPFLGQTLGDADDPTLPQGVRGLRSTLDGLFVLVRSTHVAGLGIAGLVVLVWALVRVLLGVEEAFEHVFQHRGPPRPFLRRVRAMLVVAITAPIGLTYAMTSAVLSHQTLASRVVVHVIPFPFVREVLLSVLPPLAVMLALFVLYLELPDASVRRGSALLGAALAAIGWYGIQLAHIRFQVGLARYNAIYSGFGAFPILLFSIQVSWVIVLLGAQIVAAHQDAPTLRQLARGTLRDHAERQALAVRAVIALAQRGAGARSSGVALRVLAGELGVGLRPLRSVLDELAAHGLVRASLERTDRRYALVPDPATLRASTVLDALERAPGTPDLPWEESDAPIQALLVARRAAASTSSADRTISELAETNASETRG